MSASPLVTVVMPAHNSAEFIGDAIDSVLRQDETRWELIVVDDCSADNTVEIVRQYSDDDSRIQGFVLPTNVGPAGARNFAIIRARGRYIAFLDSDDMWRSDKLTRQLDLFESSGAVIVYSGYEKINEEGEREGRVVEVPETIDYRQLLGDTVIATCTAVYDSGKAGRVLMPDIRKRQDFGLWLSILRNGGSARADQEPLAYLRKRRGSVSSNKVVAAWYVWRVYRDLEKLTVGQSSAVFMRYAWNALSKSWI